jgi:hypothetical protein
MYIISDEKVLTAPRPALCVAGIEYVLLFLPQKIAGLGAL